MNRIWGSEGILRLTSPLSLRRKPEPIPDVVNTIDCGCSTISGWIPAIAGKASGVLLHPR
jgi:hypothetical protein